MVAALLSCGGDSAAGEGKVTLRLGYFPTITHASAVAGVEEGIFAAQLGDGVRLETVTFAAGPAAVEALFSNAVDAAYIGPNPAINAFSKSDGEAIRIIAGATSGGAFLVVRDGIRVSGDLAGTTIASPQLGNTQDVALRGYLLEHGLETTPDGGGDVNVVPQENAQVLDAFATGAIDGAWVPEPFATRLVDAGGHVLVDERDLWPRGEYVTAHLVVRTEFLEEHPAVVRQLLEGHVAATEFVNASAARAQPVVNTGLARVAGTGLDPRVLESAWKNLTFTVDPLAGSLADSARAAEALGLLEATDLTDIYALEPLNEVLASAGHGPVQGLENR